MQKNYFTIAMPRFTNVLLKLVFVIHKNKEAYSEPLFVKIVDHGW